MSEQTDNLSKLIKPFGLSEEESSVYLYLLQHGFTTALILSRELQLGRTKMYRILEHLKKFKLVEQKVDERGAKFSATHPSKFQQLLSEKEQTIASLRQSLPNMVSQLSAIMPESIEKSKVLYYEGVEGLEQVSYNIVHADGLLRVFEMEHLSDFLSKEFSEDVRRKLVERNVLTRDLTNKKEFQGFTDVKEMIENYSEFRYIDPDELQINFEALIYNDVFATYTYKGNNIFCVEIYNEQLANMQKQIFDFIWKRAEPMKFTDEHGAAKIIKE